MTLTAHPAAELFPVMTPAEYAALVADMAEHGQREAIWLHPDGRILDGRNRYQACCEIGLVPEYRTYGGSLDESALLAFVVSMNLHRRHLTREQRDVVIRNLRERGMTLQKIADAVGVNVATVQRATVNDPAFAFAKAEVVGADGKHYPTHYAPRQPEAPAARAVYWSPEPEEPEAAEAEPRPAVYQPMAATVYSSRSVEYYTPPEILEAARRVMGRIDLDPASCPEAQANVRAARFFSQAEDGLAQVWRGKVWLNPPYGKTNGKSNQEIWAQRLVKAYQAGDVPEAILLVKAALGYNWFEELFRAWPVCFTRSRLSFILEDGNDEGQSKMGTALFYFGANFAEFAATFRPLGRIIPPEAWLDAAMFR